jgi:hydroxypyruvate isomerase
LCSTIPTAGDFIRTIRQNIQHIGHFHTAGNPGRNELDETQELYYPPIMRAIAETDYDGYVGQEFSPKSGADWAKSLEQAYRVCDV